ncbi:hypothetical protein Rwratislav_01462 [Rhodococcus wratislaviensis IFP 2016]|nr:hypothetical protein Rwratislav_01462 [Rhodococcus wratislaviensis IFP 2016]
MHFYDDQKASESETVKAIGFRCTKDSISWAVVEGAQRTDTVVVKRRVATAPRDTREMQLAWVAKEVREILTQFTPAGAAILAAGGAQGGLTDSLVQRIEIDGVVRSVLGACSIPTKSIKKQSICTEFGVKRNEIDTMLAEIACISETPKTHQEPVILAVSQVQP